VCICLQRGIVASGEHAGKEVVKVSERFFRPAEVELLLGDPTKAKEVLGWDADKQTSVDKLCEEMVDSDIEMAKMEMARNDLRKKLKVRAAAPISHGRTACVVLYKQSLLAVVSSVVQALCSGGRGSMMSALILLLVDAPVLVAFDLQVPY
jgi:hypothetical protein